MKGTKIAIREDFDEFLEQTRSELDLQEAPLDWKVVREMRFMMLGYQDPADRFLAVTARAHDMTLVTADQRFQRIPGPRTLANV